MSLQDMYIIIKLKYFHASMKLEFDDYAHATHVLDSLSAQKVPESFTLRDGIYIFRGTTRIPIN